MIVKPAKKTENSCKERQFLLSLTDLAKKGGDHERYQRFMAVTFSSSKLCVLMIGIMNKNMGRSKGKKAFNCMLPPLSQSFKLPKKEMRCQLKWNSDNLTAELF